jgi:hypothetical protein
MKTLLNISHDNLEAVFPAYKAIAHRLMNDYQLMMNDKFYRIIDCEFYYSSTHHPDAYVHGHQRQKTSLGEWYFHGSGVDITLYNEIGHGGILIRGIAEVSKDAKDPFLNTPIIGPLNVCTEIFRNIGPVLFEQPFKFGLVDVSSDRMGALMKEARVFAVPRIGLNGAVSAEYHKKPYRFISFLHLPHREADKVKKYLLEEAEDKLDPSEYKEYKAGRKWA